MLHPLPNRRQVANNAASFGMLMTEPTQHSAEPAAGSQPPDQLRPGDIFACQWRLDRALGAGGMGRVFSATHVSGRRDALKIMHAHLASDPVARARFLREAQVASRVRSAGVVRVLDAGLAPTGRPFVAMELLRGATLDALWKRAKRGLPVRAVLRAMDTVLEVLAECHAQGIIHRDMKPANVFVTDAGTVRLLDFGLARLPGSAGDLERNGTALGTPGFMAPEQAAGAWDHVDATSDVFSVGATLFVLLSGVRIHDAADDRHAFAVAASSAAPSLALAMPDAPGELVALVDRALCWDNRRRFPDAGAMRDAVRRVLVALGGDTYAALPVTPARRRALHAHHLDGTEPAEVSAVAQAFSWLEDGLRSDVPNEASPLARREAIDAAARWLQEAAFACGMPFEVLVLPFGFRAFEHNVWEPSPPLDTLPRRLHAAGVRAFRLDARIDARAAEAVSSVLQAASREQGVVLTHAAWEAAVPGFSVALIRPFLLIEAAHGSEITSEIARVASLLDEAPSRRSPRPSGAIALADVPVDRLREALSLEQAAALRELARRVIASAEGGGDKWAGVTRTIPGIADAMTLASMVGSLAEAGSSAARALVQDIARRAPGAAGVLARGELCGDIAAMSAALVPLTQDDNAGERLAALMTAKDFELAEVALHVLGSATSASFSLLPETERAARLELVVKVLPLDGERLAIRLLQRHGLLADESHNATRRVAARLLGRYGAGRDAQLALRAASTPMWWNAKDVREEAMAASRALEARTHPDETEGARG